MVPEAGQLKRKANALALAAPRAVMVFAMVVLAPGALVGCAAKGGDAAAINAPVADTGGYALRLRVQRPSDQKYELFQVSRQGRVGWAGGMDAMEATTKVTYERDLTPDEAKAFRDAIAKCPWIEAKPDDRGPDKAEPITIVALGLPNGAERAFTLRGDQPEVNVWVKLMKPWAAGRHKRDLDRLPEATEVPKVSTSP